MSRLYYLGEPVDRWPAHIKCAGCKKSVCRDCLEQVADVHAQAMGCCRGFTSIHPLALGTPGLRTGGRLPTIMACGKRQPLRHVLRMHWARAIGHVLRMHWSHAAHVACRSFAAL